MQWQKDGWVLTPFRSAKLPKSNEIFAKQNVNLIIDSYALTCRRQLPFSESVYLFYLGSRERKIRSSRLDWCLSSHRFVHRLLTSAPCTLPEHLVSLAVAPHPPPAARA